MDKLIKSVLNKLEENNFTAYVVGGYVRDYLLGIKSYDVDICTNALPKDLHKIFPKNNNSNAYGGFNLKIKNYNIDITTYRKELKYVKRKPTEIVYLNSLEEDIKRRDFTVNSICLDKQDKIIDLVNGVADLNNRVIRMIGDIPSRLKEDPLRILRGIRFASILDFQIEDNLLKEMKNNSILVSSLSSVRIKSELNKILLDKHFAKGLSLLKEVGVLDLLDIKYNDITYVQDLSGMWAQITYGDNLTFTKQEKENIISIREILSINKITREVLYKYGLYNSIVAADILGISRKTVNKEYNKLPLKKESDLDITSEEIMNYLQIEPSFKLKIIKDELIREVLNGKLNNKKNELQKYIEKWRI